MSGASIDIALSGLIVVVVLLSLRCIFMHEDHEEWVDTLIYGPEKGFEDDKKESK